MDNKVDFYKRLNSADAQKYEKIDNFLALSARFSPKMIKVKKIQIIALTASFALLFLGVVLFLKSWGNRAMCLLMMPVLFVAAYYRLRMLNNNFYPEMERVNTIIETDGIDAVFEGLMKARSMSVSGCSSDGRYVYIAGKTMCRLANIQKVSKRYVSHGKGGAYHVFIEVADEMGLNEIDLKQLRGLPMMHDKEVQQINAEIMIMKYALEKAEKQGEM
ncbi:hypothetical protein [uncultured Ruminococcus sp.]|uniref:hypothetical protein n=1 Tax=uncultured Ruminococcus sp. TaxID=165186 RepID=UPI0025D4AEBA|nr:hypothetical protein [uncultured Ruminococcus sp.]